jgi:hypothetical protein
MCAEGVDIGTCKMTPFLVSLFDTTPSPHRRISVLRSLLAFAHIHGEAGAPTEGIWNAVGRNSPFLCAEGDDCLGVDAVAITHLGRRV